MHYPINNHWFLKKKEECRDGARWGFVSWDEFSNFFVDLYFYRKLNKYIWILTCESCSMVSKWLWNTKIVTSNPLIRTTSLLKTFKLLIVISPIEECKAKTERKQDVHLIENYIVFIEYYMSHYVIFCFLYSHYHIFDVHLINLFIYAVTFKSQMKYNIF